MLTDKQIMLTPTEGINIQTGEIYEVEDIVVREYKIKVPMKQKGKFRYALIKDEEGELVE